MFYELKIKKNGCRNFTICKQALKMKREFNRNSFKIYDNKLENSISRARSKIFEYVLCNEFTYFVTLTINNDFDRFDLDNFRKRVSQIIRDLRHKGFDDLSYILIPEKHKNGAWHFHGLFTAGFGKDFYINDNGFLSWVSFDKIGFSSISRILNYNATCKYITKYINKDMSTVLKGKYLYFHSQGLKSCESICSIVSYGLLPLKFDFENQFVSKVTLDYYNYITFIDFLKSNNRIVLSDVQY